MKEILTNTDNRERLERQRCTRVTEELKEKIIESENLKEKINEKNEEVETFLIIQGEKIEIERVLRRTEKDLKRNQEMSKELLQRTEIMDSNAKKFKKEINDMQERRRRLEKDIQNLHDINESNQRIIMESDANIDQLKVINEGKCEEVSRYVIHEKHKLSFQLALHLSIN